MDTDPDADPDPSIFIIDLQDANKNEFKKKFFCIVLFEGTFTSFFKDKKSKRSHKTVGIKVFLTIFAWLLKDSDPGSPKTCGSGTLLNVADRCCSTVLTAVRGRPLPPDEAPWSEHGQDMLFHQRLRQERYYQWFFFWLTKLKSWSHNYVHS